MPELPEIETLAFELRQSLAGREIRGLQIRNDSILETPRRWLEKNLPGKRIVQIGRRGKYLRAELTGGFTLWIHLGMTGQLLLEDSPAALTSHTHFRLTFTGTRQELLFRDPRRFGRIALTPYRGEELPRGVQRLGLEPAEWKCQEFSAFVKRRRARIKSLLLDQRVVAGLGNIYADESLYRAGIHPLRRARKIPRTKLSRLHGVILKVLEEAVRWGGSSIDDYVHLDGERGRFQEFHKVYGKKGEGCEICRTPIQSVKLSGRTSSFCPRCQS